MSASREKQAGKSDQHVSTTMYRAAIAPREAVAVALLLFLLLLVFFWPAVLGGRVLLPTDLIFDLDPPHPDMLENR